MYVCIGTINACEWRTSSGCEHFRGGGGEQIERVAADAQESHAQHQAQQAQHEASR